MSTSLVEVGNPGSGNLSDVPLGEKIEDKEWLERPDHPLMNDVILKLMFVHVRRYDLKACRRVCKKWNGHTLPHMHSTFQVTINGNKSEKHVTTRRTVDFVELFKSNELGIPFEKYRLEPFDTTDGDGKQFLEICGESIKEIVLFQPYDTRAEYVRTIENVSDLLKSSPKLEGLTLSGQFVSRSGNIVKLFPDSTPVLSALKKLTVELDSQNSPIKYCPTFFDELFSVAGNISEIAINDVYLGETESVITLVLNSIEKLGKEPTIQSLSLDSARFEHIEILKRMAEKENGLKLKKLRFKRYVFESESQNGNSAPRKLGIQLATIFKKNLEYFHFYDGSLAIDLNEFPLMQKLKSFETRDVKDLGQTPLNLNQLFPVLENLSIHFEDVEDDSDDENDSDSLEFFSQFQVCPTVKTLITDENNFTNVRTLHNILRVFPNLRKVRLILLGDEAGEVLRQIWTGMPQLESLSFIASIGHRDRLKLDSIVTGISVEGLNEIRQVIPDLEKMTMEKRREKILNLVEQYKTQEPSIRNLTNLRYLNVIMFAEYESTYQLTDLTGYLAIYLMKRLNQLDIRCDFTKTCCEILAKDTGLEAWRFQTGNFADIIPPFKVFREHPFEIY